MGEIGLFVDGFDGGIVQIGFGEDLGGCFEEMGVCVFVIVGCGC